MTRLQLSRNASWHHPDDLGELMMALQPDPFTDASVTLDRATAYRVVSALGTLDHILRHPAGTEAVVRQLREARRILKRHAKEVPND